MSEKRGDAAVATTRAAAKSRADFHGVSPDRGDTVVALAGNRRAKSFWAQDALWHVAQSGVNTVYHPGDYGVWPHADGERFLRSTEAAGYPRSAPGIALN